MAVDLNAAREFCVTLHNLVAEVPIVGWGSSSEDRKTFRRDRETAEEKIIAAVAARGGSINRSWDGAKISLHGLRASSTSGITGACQNWIAQVTLKSMAENMGGAA